MKIRTLLISAAALALPQAALAQGFYGEVGVGAATGGQFRIDDDELASSAGYTLYGTAGYEFGVPLRIEGEVLTSKQEIDDTVVEVSATTWATMANLVFAPNIDGLLLRPYLAAGVGYAHSFLEPPDDSDSEDAGGFAWQVKAGAEVQIAPNVSLSGGYRYFTSYPDFDGAGDVDQDIHSATLGIRFSREPY